LSLHLTKEAFDPKRMELVWSEMSTTPFTGCRNLAIAVSPVVGQRIFPYWSLKLNLELNSAPAQLLWLFWCAMGACGINWRSSSSRITSIRRIRSSRGEKTEMRRKTGLMSIGLVSPNIPLSVTLKRFKTTSAQFTLYGKLLNLLPVIS
jgi:hypothetical protein